MFIGAVVFYRSVHIVMLIESKMFYRRGAETQRLMQIISRKDAKALRDLTEKDAENAKGFSNTLVKTKLFNRRGAEAQRLIQLFSRKDAKARRIE